MTSVGRAIGSASVLYATFVMTVVLHAVMTAPDMANIISTVRQAEVSALEALALSTMVASLYGLPLFGLVSVAMLWSPGSGKRGAVAAGIVGMVVGAQLTMLDPWDARVFLLLAAQSVLLSIVCSSLFRRVRPGHSGSLEDREIG